jgi:WD40 repeat protein
VELRNPEFEALKSFDTSMEKFIFHSFRFSDDGRRLVVVDGDDELRLFSVPDLVELHHEKFRRATFFKDGVAAADGSCIQLFEADESFAALRKSVPIESVPRALETDGDSLFYSGTTKARKSELVCLDSQLEVVWRKTPSPNPITCVLPTEKTIVVGTGGEGDVIVYDKNCRQIRKVPQLHSLAVTCAAPVSTYIATGGLDSLVILTDNSAVPRSSLSRVLAVVVLIASLAIYFLIKGCHY